MKYIYKIWRLHTCTHPYPYSFYFLFRTDYFLPLYGLIHRASWSRMPQFKFTEFMEPSFHNQPTARQTEAYLKCSGLKTVFSLGICEKISNAGIVVRMEKDFGGQLPAELKKIISSHLATLLNASVAICAWTTGDSRHSTTTISFPFFGGVGCSLVRRISASWKTKFRAFTIIPWSSVKQDSNRFTWPWEVGRVTSAWSGRKAHWNSCENEPMSFHMSWTKLIKFLTYTWGKHSEVFQSHGACACTSITWQK